MNNECSPWQTKRRKTKQRESSLSSSSSVWFELIERHVRVPINIRALFLRVLLRRNFSHLLRVSFFLSLFLSRQAWNHLLNDGIHTRIRLSTEEWNTFIFSWTDLSDISFAKRNESLYVWRLILLWSEMSFRYSMSTRTKFLRSSRHSVKHATHQSRTSLTWKISFIPSLIRSIAAPSCTSLRTRWMWTSTSSSSLISDGMSDWKEQKKKKK